VRDLSQSRSAALAAEKAGIGNGDVEVAELHAVCTPEEIVLADALGLSDKVEVNPSGGGLAANPMMVTGLVRIGEAFRQVAAGRNRVVGHASSGPCLQQNLVCVLEGREPA
jgi:acetyl-CoA acetyltransferase